MRLTSPPPRRPRRRAAIIILLMVSVFPGVLAFVYLTDADPLAANGKAPAEARDRSREAATIRWASQLKTPGDIDMLSRKRYHDIMIGRKPWSEEPLVKVSRDGDALKRVEEALRMPDFVVCYPEPGDDPEQKGYVFYELQDSLEADFQLALRRGDTARMERTARATAGLSTHYFRRVAGPSQFLLGCLFVEQAVSEALAVLERKPGDRELTLSLTEPWLADPYTGEDIHHALMIHTMREDPADFASMFGRGASEAEILLFYKPKRTLRVLAREAELLPPGMPEPTTDQESSLGGRLAKKYPSYTDRSPSGKFFLWFHPNWVAERDLLPAWASGIAQLDMVKGRSALFMARAMRVTRAVMLWRLDHGGAPPATLAELKPEYLQEIPADPWNGAPLGWHPALGAVTAVGPQWIPPAPVSGGGPGILSDLADGIAELRIPPFAAPP